MIMKLFIALIGLVAFVCCEPSEEIQKKMEENSHNLGNYEKQCCEELGLSQEEIKEVLKLSDDSQKAKCFFRCYIQKQGFFDEFDEPNEELIYYSSQGPKNHELITHIVLKCTDLEAEDPCQRAYDMVECFALQSENVQRYMHHQMNEAQAAGDDDDRDEL